MSEEKMIPKWKVGDVTIRRFPACILFSQGEDLIQVDNEDLDAFIATLQAAKDTKVK